MTDTPPIAVSAFRLRLGVFFILLWWLPIWALSPVISDLLGFSDNPTAKHYVLVALIIIQTIFGAIGLVLASRQVVTVIKKVPRRKAVPTILKIMWTGKTADRA
jgi:hypothetical protein